jgi:5-methylcytosine-specific restriction protein A
MTERLRGRAGVAQRKRRLARTNGLCERCLARGKTVLATVVDHKTPLALGGSDEDENTRNLCDACHDEVTAEQFGHRQHHAIGYDGWPLP